MYSVTVFKKEGFLCPSPQPLFQLQLQLFFLFLFVCLFVFPHNCCYYWSDMPDLQDRSYSEETLDTRVPMDILEEEELERISGLLQRDNLVRGLGIVEHVYRLLHCTPGTVGLVKPDPKPQPLPLVGTSVCMHWCRLGPSWPTSQLFSDDGCKGTGCDVLVYRHWLW